MPLGICIYRSIKLAEPWFDKHELGVNIEYESPYLNLASDPDSFRCTIGALETTISPFSKMNVWTEIT